MEVSNKVMIFAEDYFDELIIRRNVCESSGNHLRPNKELGICEYCYRFLDSDKEHSDSKSLFLGALMIYKENRII